MRDSNGEDEGFEIECLVWYCKPTYKSRWPGTPRRAACLFKTEKLEPSY
jgi:hypothetical protein